MFHVCISQEKEHWKCLDIKEPSSTALANIFLLEQIIKDNAKENLDFEIEVCIQILTFKITIPTCEGLST